MLIPSGVYLPGRILIFKSGLFWQTEAKMSEFVLTIALGMGGMYRIRKNRSWLFFDLFISASDWREWG
jgi:hypothetical protein